MECILLAVLFLAIDLLIACAMAPTAVPAAIVTPLPTTNLPSPTVASIALPVPIVTSTDMPTSIKATEEAESRDLVENFVNRLQAVWLQSPNVMQKMKEQYSEFVSPALLETWMGDI